MQVKVQVNYISAERFLERGKDNLGRVHIQTNVNVVGVESKGESVFVPFVVTIGYSPSVAQINIKGEAIVTGKPDELQKLKSDYDAKRPPPPMLLQAITNTSLIEATVVSRSLNIPPPLPLPSMVQKQSSQDKEQLSYVA